MTELRSYFVRPSQPILLQPDDVVDVLGYQAPRRGSGGRLRLVVLCSLKASELQAAVGDAAPGFRVDRVEPVVGNVRVDVLRGNRVVARVVGTVEAVVGEEVEAAQ